MSDEESVRAANSNPLVVKYGFGPTGVKCSTCKHFYRKGFYSNSRTYFKCELRGDTNGEGTDHRKGYDACKKHQEELFPVEPHSGVSNSNV
jgi:hypothetical protein